MNYNFKAFLYIHSGYLHCRYAKFHREDFGHWSVKLSSAGMGFNINHSFRSTLYPNMIETLLITATLGQIK